MANDPRDARLIKHKDTFYVLSHSKLLMLKRMKTNPNESLIEYIGDRTARNGRFHASVLIRHHLIARDEYANTITYRAFPFEEVDLIGVPGDPSAEVVFPHETKKLLKFDDGYIYVSPVAFQFLQDASHSKLRSFCGDEDSMASRTRRILKDYGILESDGRLTKRFEIVGHTLVL
jgi:hypothetical protein